MKRILSALFFTAFFLGTASAQEAPYRVVFDLTSRDTLDQRAVLRWINEIHSVNPQAEVEVVMYGKGFEMAMPERSIYIHQVQEAAKDPNVHFRVCAVALKNNKVDASALLKDVQTVPDGIYEIISKQHQGWGYIKVGH
jgi:hypothetical protein